uniref:Rhomboid domain-containing protein n=1 Tax=Rhabditophanes sp. KR3021 TaxID=114890 RepID=A0AC35UCJ8_9BILA
MNVGSSLEKIEYIDGADSISLPSQQNPDNFVCQGANRLQNLHELFKKHEKTGFDEMDVSHLILAINDLSFISDLTTNFNERAETILRERIASNPQPVTFIEFSDLIINRRISYDIAQLINFNEHHNFLHNLPDPKRESTNYLRNCFLFLVGYALLLTLTYEIDNATSFTILRPTLQLNRKQFNPLTFFTYFLVHQDRLSLYSNIFYFATVFTTIIYFFMVPVKVMVLIIVSSNLYGAIIHLLDTQDLSSSSNSAVGLSALFCCLICSFKQPFLEKSVVVILCLLMLIPIGSQLTFTNFGALLGGVFSSMTIIKNDMIFKRQLFNPPNGINYL